MIKRTHILFLALLVAITALLVVGCDDDRTKISSILDRPEKYIGKEVLLGGEVTKTYGVNLFVAQAGVYQVDDGSGTIWVITKHGLPREGKKVGLKGDVSSGIKIAGESFGAVVKEIERRTKD